MGINAELLAGQLSYGRKLTLHTASSGAVDHLNELYLRLSRNSRLLGLGSVRTNISYLTGISQEEVKRQVLELLANLDWSKEPAMLIHDLHCHSDLCGPARALIDQTLHDALAREREMPMCSFLGGVGASRMATNQSLFWSTDEALIETADCYVRRGFTQLKLRVGVGTIDEDARRLALLRQRFGDSINLSVDVNGQWADADAHNNINTLAQFDLDYVEQPVAAGHWGMIEKLAECSPVTIMLDESVASPADIDSVIRIGRQLAAHLKLVKFGGISPLLDAGHKLNTAGVPVMVGQMNEGALGTAAAAHCAMVLNTCENELYGADGVIGDPAGTLTYDQGLLHLPMEPGLGMSLDTTDLQQIWTNAAA